MRLLDEKGRIFGRLNLIDAIILLVLLMLAAGAAYKFFLPQSTTPPTLVKFTVLVPAVPPETARMVKAGDRLVAGASYVPVTIKEVVSEPALSTETDAHGRKVVARDPYFKDLLVTLEGQVPITTAQIKLGAQEIRAGREYYVKTLTYELKGTIIKVTLIPPADKPAG
ncbi:MAG: DUF4330 domain-containing protein [Bacillota bacterium]